MIVTSCRSAHNTPLFLARNDQHQKVEAGPPGVKPAINPVSHDTAPPSLVAGTKRTMTTTLTGRKRRATSPTYLSRVAMLNHLVIPKHHSAPASNVSINVESPTEPRIDLFSLQTSVDMCDDPKAEHIIKLSNVEQCMPRAYIRVCLAYRVPSSSTDAALARLNDFIRRTVEAKPYLAGYVVPVDGGSRTGPVEIRFLNEDYQHYAPVAVRDLLDDTGKLMDYNELDSLGLPPSRLDPAKVAALPATIADERKAPVFRAQANIVKGGIIVSLYLHHCVSDGTGLGLLTSGSIQTDDFAFRRHLDGQKDDVRSLGKRLAVFANHKTAIRTSLSYSSANSISDRKILFKRLGDTTSVNRPGRGCVISFPDAAVETLRSDLVKHMSGARLSRHDALQALIWRHMVRARQHAVQDQLTVKKSKLLIPVNIRNRLKPNLPAGYFGAAVDFACAECDIGTLVNGDNSTLALAAKLINDAIAAVDDSYIRQSIALARSEDPTIDVRDLLASNMNRVTGADMYITSWERLELYESTLDMGFGRPDWVRKPWSRDPGSCIILPRNRDKAQFEVVIQMTESDMDILLSDKDFMSFVGRVID